MPFSYICLILCAYVDMIYWTTLVTSIATFLINCFHCTHAATCIRCSEFLTFRLFISVPGIIGCLQALEAIKIAASVGLWKDASL
jgi:hypothetical protein